MPPKRAPIESSNLAPTHYVMRLQGRFGVEDAREFDLGIGALPVTLGRAPSRTDAPPYHLSLDANDSTLNREHVRIESKGSKKFEIVCMSKNGAIIDKKKIFKEEQRLWVTILPFVLVALDSTLCYLSSPQIRNQEGKRPQPERMAHQQSG